MIQELINKFAVDRSKSTIAFEVSNGQSSILINIESELVETAKQIFADFSISVKERTEAILIPIGKGIVRQETLINESDLLVGNAVPCEVRGIFRTRKYYIFYNGLWSEYN